MGRLGNSKLQAEAVVLGCQGGADFDGAPKAPRHPKGPNGKGKSPATERHEDLLKAVARLALRQGRFLPLCGRAWASSCSLCALATRALSPRPRRIRPRQWSCRIFSNRESIS